MLQADRDGFLVGQPLGNGGADRLLHAIKGDTGKILAAMRQAARGGPAQRTATPEGRSGAQALPERSGVVATPAGRGAMRVRDATGRFAGGGTEAAQKQRLGAVADAAAKMARTAETQRRDDKTDRKNQKRGADGRFGAGADGKGGRGGVGGALAHGAGVALEGGERIDPLLGAVGEVRGMVKTASNVATPIGRALGGLLGRDKQAEEKKQTSWLKRIVTELRSIRGSKGKASRGSGGGPDGEDGGLLSSISGLLRMLPGVAGAAGGGVLAALPKLAAGAVPWLKAAAKRLPLIGSLFEAVDGVMEDNKIANDATLTDDEKRVKRFESAGSAGGAIGGALTGGAIGTAILPGIGTVIGAGIGGIAGSGLGKRAGGFISGMFESGSAGAGAVSSGKGDAGGASYGTHQLSSNTGTLQKFLGASGYGEQFAGMAPGTPEFNKKWKAIAAGDPNFAGAQHDFIQATHVDPQMAKLKAAGIDLSGRGEAVKEAVFSTATQFGPKTNVIRDALAGGNTSTMSDADIISAVQNYKIANNASLFRSSSGAVQGGTLNRAISEKDALLKLNSTGSVLPTLANANVASPPPLSLPPTPALPPPIMVAAAPQLEPSAGARLNSSPPAAAPSPSPVPPGQDVRDRMIAHIVTGGIAGGIAHR